jgi:hypothetical protein
LLERRYPREPLADFYNVGLYFESISTALVSQALSSQNKLGPTFFISPTLLATKESLTTFLLAKAFSESLGSHLTPDHGLTATGVLPAFSQLDEVGTASFISHTAATSDYTCSALLVPKAPFHSQDSGSANGFFHTGLHSPLDDSLFSAAAIFHALPSFSFSITDYTLLGGLDLDNLLIHLLSWRYFQLSEKI